MTALLTGNLPLIAAAPSGVKTLRALILDLAVRGKLVPQDPNDEPASALLKRIAAEKARLVKAREIRSEKPTPRITDDEKPFELPPQWEWVRAAEICSSITDGDHLPPPKADDGIAFLVIGDVRDGVISPAIASRRVPESYYEALDWTRKPKVGDLLLTTVGSYGIPVPVIISAPFCFQRHIALLRPAVRDTQGWLFAAYRSQFLFDQLTAIATGTAQKTVPLSGLRLTVIPLPPLAEQQRIVARVDELMALCDRLEAQQADAEAAHATLVKTLLDTLTQSQDADDFAANWQRLSQHFDTIFTTETSLDALKQTLLQLAVMGMLVATSTWPSQPSTLGRVATLQNGYAFKSEWFAPRGVRLLRNANVSHGVMCWDDVVYLPEQQASEFERFQLNEGDIVLSLDRPFITSGTKVARVRKLELPCLLLQRVGRFQLNPEMILGDYLFLWINSPHFTSQIDPGRSNGVPHISSKQVEAAEIYVPPLAEQRRIVAKVDELMALCDDLKARLAESRTVQTQLATALVERAVAA
ncbi:Type-1 restriction enzyme EcoAI specificity protein [Candidatus Terasakiella magnetica]|nr:Type-1 restriction enzyme EcoAI specificity protein [Candidatus Terasakiella magnetica]